MLVESGYVEAEALDRLVEAHETTIGPHIGAKAVARAWIDPAFRRDLLADAATAIAPFTHLGRVGDQLIVVENTPEVHNMVVCTLCSCYPWDVLGLPPVWYKSPAYRSRAVREPRAVLAELGLTVPSERRFACGIRLPNFVIWCYRCDRQEPTAGPRSNSRNSSGGIA